MQEGGGGATRRRSPPKRCSSRGPSHTCSPPRSGCSSRRMRRPRRTGASWCWPCCCDPACSARLEHRSDPATPCTQAATPCTRAAARAGLLAAPRLAPQLEEAPLGLVCTALLGAGAQLRAEAPEATARLMSASPRAQRATAPCACAATRCRAGAARLGGAAGAGGGRAPRPRRRRRRREWLPRAARRSARCAPPPPPS